MSTELQHWLGRNRPPRVQITYDVETLGASVKLEIPFIGGIIGDFKGGDDADTPIADRPFTEIDRDNFTSVMENLAPSLQVNGNRAYTVVRTPEGTAVQPLLSNGTAQTFSTHLSFARLDDFAPPSIISQTDSISALMQKRQNLSDLMAKLGTDPSLEGTLASQSAAQTLTLSKASLPAANTGLGTTTTGTLKDFNDAVTAVLAVETQDPNKTIVTNAQNAVKAAVGDANGGYTKAFAAATAAGANAGALQAAGDAGWTVAGALADGVATLQGITAAYTPNGEADPKKVAQTAVAKAQGSVAAYIPLAATAALQATSALALNPVPAS